MLKQCPVDPLEVIADMIKQIGGALDDQVQKDEEGVARRRRNAVVALLRQPGEASGTAFGDRDERALASNELDGDQLRPTDVETHQQQRSEGDSMFIRPDRGGNLKPGGLLG